MHMKKHSQTKEVTVMVCRERKPEKEKYVGPEMEILAFETKDVVCDSNTLPFVPNPLNEIYDDKGKLIDVFND